MGHQPGRRDRDADRRGDRRAAQLRHPPRGVLRGRRSGARARHGRAPALPRRAPRLRSRAPWRGSSCRPTPSIRPTRRSRAARSRSRPSRRRSPDCSTTRTLPRRRACACSRRSPPRCPRSTPDRRTYTFTIRPGYRFSPPSGEPVTAESFRRGIEHALSPALGEPRPRRAAAGRRARGARLPRRPRAPHPRAPGPRRDAGDHADPAVARLPQTAVAALLRAAARRRAETSPAAHPTIRHPRPGPTTRRRRSTASTCCSSAIPTTAARAPMRSTRSCCARASTPPARSSASATAPWDGGHARGPAAAPASAHNPALLPETRFVAFNARRGAFASARTRRAAAYALSRSALAAVWDLVPSSGLVPPGIATTRPVTLAPPPRPLPAATAVMAVSPGCAACRRSYEIARTALARVGITLHRRTATHRRGPSPAGRVRPGPDQRGARVSRPRDLPHPHADRRRPEHVATRPPPAPPSAGCAGLRAPPATPPRPTSPSNSPNTTRPSPRSATPRSDSASPPDCPAASRHASASTSPPCASAEPGRARAHRADPSGRRVAGDVDNARAAHDVRSARPAPPCRRSTTR